MNWDQNKELVEQILRTGMYAKLYGVKFLLYDEDRNPIGEFTSDDDGYRRTSLILCPYLAPKLMEIIGCDACPTLYAQHWTKVLTFTIGP